MAGALIGGVGGRRPEVDASAFVAPGAVVVGAVRLGARASVWYQAVLRGDAEGIVIGADSNVQDNCTVHADPGFPCRVGERVTVGHNAVLHGCVIEDDVLVGMGARVLNGARIGAGSLIAAGAVVPQGTEIPPGSLVAGVPGRVRRPLEPAEREAIRANAQGYLLLAEAHTGVEWDEK
ncbi:gamma carbonic anhydrase family protein [Kitasatospora sp. NPDC006697]|uniref:gamma carbonic anhydrase family protein n=1 Tax=Kitasatospora sp. NPDC006697 TaxID=3364020 RepID=UPI0036AE0E61